VSFHRGATTLFGVAFLVIGAAAVVRTALLGGGVGFLIGALFMALGAARLYLLFGRR
jgi:hypothetical protein